MGIICSTDDTQNWQSKFKGNEEENNDERAPTFEEASNPYDNAERASNYYAPPSTDRTTQNTRGSDRHPRAY